MVSAIIMVVRMTELGKPGSGGTPEKTQGVETMYVKGIASDDDQRRLILFFERLFHAS
jgi:hypothetical protein